MSYREKIAWISFLSTVAIWSPYFLFMLIRIRTESPPAVSIIGAFGAAVTIQALITAIAGLTIKLTSADELKDERDSAVEARAVKIAYIVLVVSIFLVVSLTVSLASSITKNPSTGIEMILLLSQLTLFCFVFAEATRFLALVIYYRRGV